MKILPVILQENKFYNKQHKKLDNNLSISNNFQIQNLYPSSYYLLSFQARVEKDLDSFIKRNETNLPYSIKAYVENLSTEQKNAMTPLEAQRNAFEYLTICESVQDVKEAYPKEPLFQNLKEVDQVKSNRGLLYDIRFAKDELSESGERLLNTEDDSLTVYLLKKIFLEGKTIAEINDDLDKDINEAFKKEDKNYILSSTLSALGIDLPSVSYLNSLRYTREGYSDFMGEKISQRWKDMTDEQKQAIISSHSVALPQERKNELAKFSKQRWNNLTPEQKIDQIAAMQKGNQKKRIIMIDAWNNSPEVRVALAKYLTKNNFYSPQSIIYRENDFTPAMKIVMARFWSENHELAEKLGEQIALSYNKYEEAEKAGKLKELETSIEKESAKIRAEIKKMLKVSNANETKTSAVDEYKNMFSFLPKSLLEKQCEILSNMNEADVKLWIRYCMGQKLDSKSMQKAEGISKKVAQNTSKEIQSLIVATIITLEQNLKPIFDIKTGKSFKPIFPVNINFRFPDITRMYFGLKKHGIEKFQLFDSVKNSNSNVTTDFASEAFTVSTIGRNPNVKFDKSLMQYKYKLSTEPDFEAINVLYEEIMSCKVTEVEAYDTAKKCFNGENSDVVSFATVIFTNFPYQHFLLNSPKVGIGAKIRTFNQLCKTLNINGLNPDVQYSDVIVGEYRKRFIEFFSIEE